MRRVITKMTSVIMADLLNTCPICERNILMHSYFMLCNCATGMSIEIAQNFAVMNSPLSRTVHFGSAENILKIFSHSTILTMKMNSSLQYKTLVDAQLTQVTRAYMSI